MNTAAHLCVVVCLAVAGCSRQPTAVDRTTEQGPLEDQPNKPAAARVDGVNDAERDVQAILEQERVPHHAARDRDQDEPDAER